jgi:hypothetical protein
MCRISKQRIAVACWLACSGALAQAATPVVESAAANSVGTQIAITGTGLRPAADTLWLLQVRSH